MQDAVATNVGTSLSTADKLALAFSKDLVHEANNVANQHQHIQQQQQQQAFAPETGLAPSMGSRLTAMRSKNSVLLVVSAPPSVWQQGR